MYKKSHEFNEEDWKYIDVGFISEQRDSIINNYFFMEKAMMK